MDIPEDIFTEQDADPDTLAHLGPLRRFAGTWQGMRGVDLNPKADGPEQRDYQERIVMQPIDAQSNGPHCSMACAITSTSTRPRKRSPSTTRPATGSGSPTPG